MKQAIHCTTQKEFNKVLEIFENKGWIWSSCTKPLSLTNVWNNNKEKSCIENKNLFGYADLQYFKKEGCTIIPAKQYIKENTKLIKLTTESGQVIEIEEAKLIELGFNIN